MELASKGQLRASYLRWAVVTVPFIMLLGFASSRLAEAGDANCWYRALAKPDLTPPGWVFPVAWTALYILMGLALALILNARGSRWRWPAVALFFAQLAINLAWSPLFFGAHQVLTAAIATAVMLALTIATAILFGRIRPLAAWLLVPYMVWISFAGLLTWDIHQRNPNAETLVCGGSTTQIAL